MGILINKPYVTRTNGARIVIPAKAGIQSPSAMSLDSGFRRNDGKRLTLSTRDQSPIMVSSMPSVSSAGRPLQLSGSRVR